MSCHDIGRGMNTVTRKTIELLEEKKITQDVAKELISTARDGVNWCDGNESEAVAYIWKNRCGYCLEKIEPGKPMYCLWDANLKGKDEDRLYKETRESIVSPYLCPQCFDRVIREFTQDDSAGERQKKYIEENFEPDRWMAVKVPSGSRWNFMF